MKKIFKALLVLIVVSFIVPQIALASWWNPFSWKIFNVFKKPQTTTINTNQSVQKNDDPIIEQDISNEEIKIQEESRIKQEKELSDTKKELQKASIELQKLKEKDVVSPNITPASVVQNTIEPPKDSLLKIAQCQAKRDADYSDFVSKVDKQIESGVQSLKDQANSVLSQLKQSQTKCLSNAEQYSQGMTPQANQNLMDQEFAYCNSTYYSAVQKQKDYTDQLIAKTMLTRDTFLSQGKASADKVYQQCINK